MRKFMGIYFLLIIINHKLVNEIYLLHSPISHTETLPAETLGSLVNPLPWIFVVFIQEYIELYISSVHSDKC